MISTKQDLLRVMTSLDACKPAVEWVAGQDGTAHEIWLKCQMHGWLIWLAGRLNQAAIVAFAQERAGMVTGDGEWKVSCSSGLVDDGFLKVQCDEAARHAREAKTPAEAATYARLTASIAVCTKADDEHKQLAAMHAMWPEIAGNA